MRLLPRVHRFRLFFPAVPLPLILHWPFFLLMEMGGGRRRRRRRRRGRLIFALRVRERTLKENLLLLPSFSYPPSPSHLGEWLILLDGCSGPRAKKGCASPSHGGRGTKKGREEEARRQKKETEGGGEAVSVRWLLPLLDNSPFSLLSLRRPPPPPTSPSREFKANFGERKGTEKKSRGDVKEDGKKGGLKNPCCKSHAKRIIVVCHCSCTVRLCLSSRRRHKRQGIEGGIISTLLASFEQAPLLHTSRLPGRLLPPIDYIPPTKDLFAV